MKWMKVDESGWKWMKVEESGWKWMKVDGSGWNWMKVDEIGWNEWKWMKVDERGWKWIKWWSYINTPDWVADQHQWLNWKSLQYLVGGSANLMSICNWFTKLQSNLGELPSKCKRLGKDAKKKPRKKSFTKLGFYVCDREHFYFWSKI